MFQMDEFEGSDGVMVSPEPLDFGTESSPPFAPADPFGDGSGTQMFPPQAPVFSASSQHPFQGASTNFLLGSPASGMPGTFSYVAAPPMSTAPVSSGVPFFDGGGGGADGFAGGSDFPQAMSLPPNLSSPFAYVPQVLGDFSNPALAVAPQPPHLAAVAASSAPPPFNGSPMSSAAPISIPGHTPLDVDMSGGGNGGMLPTDGFALADLEQLLTGENLSTPADFKYNHPEPPQTWVRERAGSFSTGRRSSLSSSGRFNPLDSRHRAHSFGADSENPHMYSQSVPDSITIPPGHAHVFGAHVMDNPANALSRPRSHTLDSASLKLKRKPVVPSDGKVCSCCGCNQTPMWRDGRDGNRLCNACGIRWQKYGVSCVQCKYVPRKLESTPGQKCKRCGFDLPPPEVTRRQMAASRHPKKHSTSDD